MADGVMIALEPRMATWSKMSPPHMTLVYGGTTKEASPSTLNEMQKVALDFARTYPIQTLNVDGLDVFGGPDSPLVDVLRLIPSPSILEMRSRVERWNRSEHPFNPHVTIGPRGSSSGIDLPARVVFDKIRVHWGDSWVRTSFAGIY